MGMHGGEDTLDLASQVWSIALLIITVFIITVLSTISAGRRTEWKKALYGLLILPTVVIIVLLLAAIQQRSMYCILCAYSIILSLYIAVFYPSFRPQNLKASITSDIIRMKFTEPDVLRSQSNTYHAAIISIIHTETYSIYRWNNWQQCLLVH